MGMNCPFKAQTGAFEGIQTCSKICGTQGKKFKYLTQYETDLVASAAQLKESRHVSAKDELDWNKSSRDTKTASQDNHTACQELWLVQCNSGIIQVVCDA